MNLQKFVTTLLTILLLAVAGASSALAATPREPAEPAREERKLVPPDPIAELRLAGGSELTFYQLTAEDGTARAIGVGSYIPPGGVDPTSVRELHSANPHELFYALSDRGADVPPILSEMYANRYGKQPQGWAIELIKPFIYDLFTCESTEFAFSNAVAASGLSVTSYELSTGPHNSLLWKVEDPTDIYPTYFRSKKPMTTSDAYFRVMYCDEDPMYPNNSVKVRLQYQESPKGYAILSSGELQWLLHHPGAQMSFMSYPFDSNLDGWNLWFWNLIVEDVRPNDTVHIGMAWNY